MLWNETSICHISMNPDPSNSIQIHWNPLPGGPGWRRAGPGQWISMDFDGFRWIWGWIWLNLMDLDGFRWIWMDLDGFWLIFDCFELFFYGFLIMFQWIYMNLALFQTPCIQNPLYPGPLIPIWMCVKSVERTFSNRKWGWDRERVLPGTPESGNGFVPFVHAMCSFPTPRTNIST